MMVLHVSRKLNTRITVRLVVAAFLMLLIVASLFHGLVVRNYTVSTDKLPSGSRIRIVVIADLHSHVWGEDQQPLLNMIAAQQPDIIALTGDIVDDREPIAGAQLFLERVTDIAPTYYVSGNHEYLSGQYNAIFDMIKSCGIIMLSNERLYLTIHGVKLCLCGIDDPELLSTAKERALLQDNFSDLDGSTYSILLAHRPELIEEYLPYDFDLVLSGHTHGGQIRFPLLLNGLFAPNQGWFPEYGGGRYDFGNQSMIVSRGCGVEAKLPRVFNPPEIVVVDIEGEA